MAANSMVMHLRTLVQFTLVELSSLTSTGHLVDLANTMGATMDVKFGSTDLIRKPVLLSLLLFLFLSFPPCENIQYLISDVLLLFRILLGLAAPEFADLSASGSGLITGYCES